MTIKQFKTESKKLLDLMANSIYTNRDIFLRELISNASDAIDKKYYLSLTDSKIDSKDLKIVLSINDKEKTITIEDNGIGMNKEDLENNLGTIAKSGSQDFKDNIEDNKNIDIIGQFGVGFYSGFMVADKIEVTSKKVNEDKAYSFVSTLDGYEIKNESKDAHGTIIKLYIKEDTKDIKYSEYLNKDKVEELVKKYSDYIRYPIMLEDKTLNTMLPIWKKNKKSIKDEDYDNFYMNNYFDFEKPLKKLHYKVEGNTSYTALLYIPSKRPYNYFTTDYKTDLKLYCKGVFIKNEVKELISDHYRFVRGIIDSEDLSLNISREILQEDKQMQLIKKSIDKKIKAFLENMLQNERADYEKFFDEFGQQLKFGVYDNFGANKDELIDLIMFKSSKNDSYVTLKEYVENMKKDQKDIYFATGESIDKIKKLPQIEKVLDKGYEVLYFTDNVDEFMTSIINQYQDKTFKSIQKEDFEINDKKEKEELEKKTKDNQDLIAKIKELLKDDISEVKLSSRLKSHPVCLVSDNNISIDMEKTLKALNQDVKSNKILEINPEHELFSKLKSAYDSKENIDDYVFLLLDQALLLAGLPIKDPVEYSKRMSNILIKSIK